MVAYVKNKCEVPPKKKNPLFISDGYNLIQHTIMISTDISKLSKLMAPSFSGKPQICFLDGSASFFFSNIFPKICSPYWFQKYSWTLSSSKLVQKLLQSCMSKSVLYLAKNNEIFWQSARGSTVEQSPEPKPQRISTPARHSNVTPQTSPIPSPLSLEHSKDSYSPS